MLIIMEAIRRWTFFLVVFGATSQSASAGLITNIPGLDIGGTLYDVTFHANPSFNDLWDANADRVFGNDTSIFNAAPTFGMVRTGAVAAANAIVDLFGTSGADGTGVEAAAGCGGAAGNGTYCDGFLLPFASIATGSNSYVIAVNVE